MNTKIYMLTALAVCIGLVLSGFSAGQLESSVTLSSSGVVQQTSIGTYSYIISVSDSNYQMINGTTGQIIFQSTNSSQVFSNVVGNCSVGSSVDVESGVYAVNTMWTMIKVNNVTVNFEQGAELVAGNNLNTSVLMLFQSNNDSINGITIDGNAANQAVVDGDTWNCGGGLWYMQTDGVYIAGSNDEVNNAFIYDCRMIGVQIWVDGAFGNAVNSGVVNSKIYDCGWNGFTAGNPFDLNCYLINSEVYGCSDVGASTYGTCSLITGNYVHDLNGTTGGGGNAEWGIAVEGGCNSTITQNTIQNCSIGIEDSGLNNCIISNNLVVGASQNRPQYGIVLSNGYGTGGCEYNSVTDNNVTGMYCNTTSYLGGIGIYLEGVTFSSIGGNYVSQCGSGGIFLDGTSNYNTVTQNTVFDQLAGQYYAMAIGKSGIEIAGSGNYISQNQAFDDRSGAARTQQYGIAVDSGAYENILIGNNVYGNINAQIDDGNVPENTMINNTGYNPIGHIASPISGNTAYLVDSGSNSTWISGRLYTNTGSPKELDISAGTISVVAQNGVPLFTSTNYTVTLQPGDTFSVTFSTVPTINVIGQ